MYNTKVSSMATVHYTLFRKKWDTLFRYAMYPKAVKDIMRRYCEPEAVPWLHRAAIA